MTVLRKMIDICSFCSCLQDNASRELRIGSGLPCVKFRPRFKQLNNGYSAWLGRWKARAGRKQKSSQALKLEVAANHPRPVHTESGVGLRLRRRFISLGEAWPVKNRFDWRHTPAKLPLAAPQNPYPASGQQPPHEAVVNAAVVALRPH